MKIIRHNETGDRVILLKEKEKLHCLLCRGRIKKKQDRFYFSDLLRKAFHVECEEKRYRKHGHDRLSFYVHKHVIVPFGHARVEIEKGVEKE